MKTIFALILISIVGISGFKYWQYEDKYGMEVWRGLLWAFLTCLAGLIVGGIYMLLFI